MGFGVQGVGFRIKDLGYQNHGPSWGSNYNAGSSV